MSVYVCHDESDVDVKISCFALIPVKVMVGMVHVHKISDALDPNLGYLEDDGNLKIRVFIQVWNDNPLVWFPRKSLHHDLLACLVSGREGDACFIVAGKRFAVLKCLVARRAPVLAEIASTEPPGTPISIDVDADAFCQTASLLSTEKVGFRELWEVADRFG
jgi:hypothetical protein